MSFIFHFSFLICVSEQFIVWGTKDLNTSAQLILAKRLGFFDQVGLKVQCTLFPSEQHLTEAFETTGEKPLLWSQTVPELLRLRAKGYPVKIIAPLADVSASYQVILREDAGIVLPGELETRKIGIVRGSLNEVAFRNMAKDFGVDLSKVNFVNASPAKQLELFVNHEIDGLACWEPWTSQARYVGGTLYFSGLHSMIPGHEGRVNWLTGQSMVVTFEEAIHQAPDILMTALKGLKKATNYLNTTLNKAAFVLSDLLGVANDELVVLLQKNLYAMKMDALFRVGLVSIRDTFAMMEPFDEPEHDVRVKLTTLPITDLYHTQLLQQVDPFLVQIVDPSDSTKHVEILSEGNVYYPAQVKIHHIGTAPLRYMVVDDTRVVTELFAEIVSMLGGTVVSTASTGSEAIGQYVEQLPEIIVMDISMPDMNGIEAIKRIFAINPAANIIVLSGNNYADTRQEVFQLGVKLFIGKPSITWSRFYQH
jgi:ABC-type nitrate/sulfonate/bicarbonate transport system substrate-binding protein/CheY-like chemotaxis protein